MNGMLKYPVAESTGRATENIDEILAGNQVKPVQEGSKQSRLSEFFFGPESGVDMGFAPDLALTPFLSKKGMTGMLKWAKRKYYGRQAHNDAIGKIGITGIPTEIKRVLRQGKRAIKKKLKTNKAYQSWMNDTTPSKQLAQIGEEARAIAIEDMTGKKGFQRFLHTVDAPKEFNTKRMHQAFQALVRPGMKSAKFSKMSKLDKLGDNVAGFARVQGKEQMRNLAPAEVRVREFGPLLRRLANTVGEKTRQKGTSIHEFTHVAQQPKPSYPGGAYMDKFAEQYKLSPKQVQFLENSFWPAADDISTHWKYKYAEKMKPFVRKQYDIMDKDVLTRINPTTGPDKWKYWLSPHEISARAAQMRHLLPEVSPRLLKKGGKLWDAQKEEVLKDYFLRENPYIDLKGTDQAINKLWGLGPVGLAIDQHISADKGK